MFATRNPWRSGISAALVALLVAGCGGGEEAAAPEAQAAAAAEPLANERTAPVDRTAPARSMAPNSMADSAKKAAPAKKANKLYIVQLVEPPVATNKATRPARGGKINKRDTKVAAYVQQLRSRQDAVARSVSARKLYSYSYAFNGFSAELSDQQVQQLRATKGVVAVSKDTLRKVNTSSTPSFLGLSGDNGFWAKTGATGEGVVIGIVDGGVWPEHPSFDGTGYSAPPAWWGGICQEGEEFTASLCNNKLIGARYYNVGWGGNAQVDIDMPHEYNSPRDWGGHGTHTASTAGGNANVTVTGPAAIFGSITGMAPRARIAVYKACFDDGGGGSCWQTDSVAAIDQAVEDGVDVINFSVGGSTDTLMDAVELAFLNAAAANVFVAVSAGNDGPDASTVEHPSPWLTTVAAATHNRVSQGTVTLGNSASYTGASVNNTNVPAGTELIDASQAGMDGADPTKVGLCYAAVDNADTAVLDPAKVTGKIVVCKRGTTDRVHKSLAVFEAGGVGMILVNTSDSQSLNNDYHSVPTVHLANASRAAVTAYALGSTPTAAIPPAVVNTNAQAPFQSDFSSRGPTFAVRSELLKPDISAPGTDVLAAVAPPGNSGRSFDLYSGTSMASPHIAGIAALFKQARPTWSPMMIKSALMTTASAVLGGSVNDPVHVFGQGAGHVRPNNALDPGLVFDHDIYDWYGFLCTTEIDPSECQALDIPLVQARNLNLPSISVANVPGIQTVTRRVKNVTTQDAIYEAEVAGLEGFTVNVTPRRLRVRAGEEAQMTVKFSRKGAALNEYAAGSITLSDGKHTVRMPVVAQPVSLAAPAEVGGTFPVSFGYTGSFSATPNGLVAATKTPFSIQQGQQKVFSLVVPASTAYTRVALFDSDLSAQADLDLYVFQGDTMIGISGSTSSQEKISFANLPAGTYTVLVDGFSVTGTTTFNLYSWNVPSAAAGQMVLKAPTKATLGQTGTVTVKPCVAPINDRRVGNCELPAANKYLGLVGYAGSPGMPSPTVVFIEK